MFDIIAELQPQLNNKGYARSLGMVSFVREPGFLESKRFNRYVHKTRISLATWIQEEFPAWERTMHDDTIVNWIILMYVIRYRNFEPPDTVPPYPWNEVLDILNDWGDRLHKPATESFNVRAYLNTDDDRFIQELISGSADKIATFVDKELHAVCAERIEHICGQDSEKYDDTNYQLTLPETIWDHVEILERLTEWVHEDIERELINNQLGRISARLHELAFDHYKQQIEHTKEHNAELIDQTNVLRDENLSLQQQLKKLENQPTTVVKEVNSKGLADLQKKYDRLQDKYNRLKQQIAAEDDFSVDDLGPAEPMSVIDYNLRYTFVMDTDTIPIMQQRLIERFPNAVFLRGETGIASLDADKIDLVICLNKFICHSTYYGYKSQCKARKIPFLNCQYKDIDMIEELIRRYYA